VSSSAAPAAARAQAAAARLRAVDCLDLIEDRLPTLSGTSRRVGEAITRDPWAVLGMTIYELAEISDVSLPSVTRFCRALGYPGFRDLLQALAQSLGRLDVKDLEPPKGEDEGLPALVNGVIQRQIEALQNTLRTLDYDALELAVDAVAKAQRLTVVGSGGAYVSALGTAIKLNWAGVPAIATSPDLFANQLVGLDMADVVIAISHQGRTRDVIETVRLARDFGARTISISGIVHAPIAEVAEIPLAVFSPARALHGTFTVAHTAELVVADILAAAVAERKWQNNPPRRAAVADWIEQHLRLGPTGADKAARRRARGATPIEKD
jgi:DNA-binding MurR/RpiR family transcriptional regulator